MENSKICLDTDVLIDTLTNKKDTVDYVKGLEDTSSNLMTTSVNTFELYYGGYETMRKERNIEACEKLLDRLLVLDFTRTASLKAAQIMLELESRGRSLEIRDIFIASIAMSNGCSLATRNISHFNRIAGLQLFQAP